MWGKCGVMGSPLKLMSKGSPEPGILM